MKKTTILWIFLDLIFLTIFNVIFFLLGEREHNASVWISYCFIHFAYLMLVLTPFLTRKGKNAVLFKFSIFSVSAVYFIVAFVTGIVFILIAPESLNIPIVVQLVIAGLYGIILISNMLANERTANADEKRRHEIAYVKDASTRLKILLDDISDKGTRKKVEKVYDAVYSSPVKSYPALAQIENNIIQTIDDLDDEVATGNNEKIASIAKSLLSMVNERNRKLKVL